MRFALLYIRNAQDTSRPLRFLRIILTIWSFERIYRTSKRLTNRAFFYFLSLLFIQQPKAVPKILKYETISIYFFHIVLLLPIIIIFNISFAIICHTNRVNNKYYILILDSHHSNPHLFFIFFLKRGIRLTSYYILLL